MSRPASAPSRYDDLPSTERRPRRAPAHIAEKVALLSAIVAIGDGLATIPLHPLPGLRLMQGDDWLTLAVLSHGAAIFGLFTAVFAAARQSLSNIAGTRSATVFALATNAFVALAWIFFWVYLYSGAR